MHFFYSTVKALSSVKITICFVACSMVLVFVGTLSQVKIGIFLSQEIFFHSWFVMYTLPNGFTLPVFFGGYFVMTVLALNLLCSAFVVHQYTWRKLGIILIHLGLVIMLLGQMLTDAYQVESEMTIKEGEAKNYSSDRYKVELVVIDKSAEASDKVISIPSKRLQLVSQKKLRNKTSRYLRNEILPFHIEVKQYYPNTHFMSLQSLQVMQAGGSAVISNSTPQKQHAQAILTMREQLKAAGQIANQGFGTNWQSLPKNRSTNDDERDIASTLITLHAKDDSTNYGTYLLTSLFKVEDTLAVGAKSYAIALRYKRYYKDFSLLLNDFRFDRYLGTEIPKNFSSSVTIYEPGKSPRDSLIYMNHPLRYKNETYYQASFLSDEKTTILQVMKNPGMAFPYLACLVIVSGMLWQFLFSLWSYLKKERNKKEQKQSNQKSKKSIIFTKT